MMAFFRPSRANIDALKAAARSKLDKIARISRAGLQYAIEQHKVFFYVLFYFERVYTAVD